MRQSLARIAVACFALTSALSAPASANITWSLVGSMPTTVTNFSVCNNGAFHRIVSFPSARWDLQIGRVDGSGSLNWDHLADLPSDGQLTCTSAGDAYVSDYRQSAAMSYLLYQGVTNTTNPACMGPQTGSCVHSMFSPARAVGWSYYYFYHGGTLQLAGDSAVRFPSTHELHLIDPNTVVDFTSGVARLYTVNSAALQQTGTLSAAVHVASTKQAGNRIVFAVNNDLTFWMNRESAPGTLNLNPGGAWQQISVPYDMASMMVAAMLIEIEAAVVNGQLTIYAMTRGSAENTIFAGTITP